MKIIFPSVLTRWASSHPIATPSLEAWKIAVEGAHWKKPSDVRATWTRYSHIRTTCNTEGLDRIIFDIGGSDFRLVTHVSYKAHRSHPLPNSHGAVFLRWFGPHSAYSKLDWTSSEATNYE